MKFIFLTLFPEQIEPILKSSILGRAVHAGHVEFECVQLRDFATDKHRRVDDAPFGGGAGMVLRPDVLYAAWHAIVNRTAGKKRTILLSPQGPIFQQKEVPRLLQYDALIFICGHYEGLDERWIEECVDEELSIGDFVLTGGELPALVITDAITRFIPGVLGNENSAVDDSLSDGLLKYPQYTRPAEFLDKKIPDVLLSGNHSKIAEWRQAKRESVTQKKRPDLWALYNSRRKT